MILVGASYMHTVYLVFLFFFIGKMFSYQKWNVLIPKVMSVYFLHAYCFGGVWVGWGGDKLICKGCERGLLLWWIKNEFQFYKKFWMFLLLYGRYIHVSFLLPEHT